MIDYTPAHHMLRAVGELVKAGQHIADNATSYSYGVLEVGSQTVDLAAQLEKLVAKMTLACEDTNITKEVIK